MATILSSRGSKTITFDPIDFLMEAIEEFLESGARPKKIASCVIKIATATELLLKDKLEKICPALVLDSIDPNALQVAKIYGLANKMLNPEELDNVDLRTVSFPKLLNRSALFFDLRESKAHLGTLHDVRNNLLHHRGRVDVAEVNLLLIGKVFPFLEKFTADNKLLIFRLKAGTWRKLRKLEESSRDVVLTDIAKKLAHYEGKVRELSEERIKFLAGSAPELVKDETVLESNLLCPACKNDSMTAISGFDVDYDESGPTSAYVYHRMRCRVCGLDLDDSEIEQIIAHFEKFFAPDHAPEKKFWEQVLSEPEPHDEY